MLSNSVGGTEGYDDGRNFRVGDDFVGGSILGIQQSSELEMSGRSFFHSGDFQDIVSSSSGRIESGLTVSSGIVVVHGCNSIGDGTS